MKTYRRYKVTYDMAFTYLWRYVSKVKIAFVKLLHYVFSCFGAVGEVQTAFRVQLRQ